MRRFIRRRHAAGCVVVAAVLGLLPVPATAANREHQQLMADMRMLQEQTQQLQVSLNALLEALKLVSGRIDDQAGSTRKALADQKLIIDGLGGDVRVVREKLDENAVRLSSLQQELEAIRLTVTAPPPVSYLPSSGAGEVPNPDDPDAPLAAPGPPAAPLAAGLSPQRLYDSAYADFASGQWATAILGFETYIKAFPRTEQADDAQLYIGESYNFDGKFQEAVAAYDKVINDYPTGDAVPMAYYKRALALLRLDRPDQARESLDAVIARYPDSDTSRLARQLLDRLNRQSR